MRAERGFRGEFLKWIEKNNAAGCRERRQAEVEVEQTRGTHGGGVNNESWPKMKGDNGGCCGLLAM